MCMIRWVIIMIATGDKANAIDNYKKALSIKEVPHKAEIRKTTTEIRKVLLDFGFLSV